jgi:hypothetical protein
MLLYLKFDWESNTKKVEDSTSYATGIYLPSSDQRFKHYDIYARQRIYRKLQFWTDYSDERKIKSAAVQVGFFP